MDEEYVGRLARIETKLESMHDSLWEIKNSIEKLPIQEHDRDITILKRDRAWGRMLVGMTGAVLGSLVMLAAKFFNWDMFQK